MKYLSCLLLLFLVFIFASVLAKNPVLSATIKSPSSQGYVLETNVTPPPTPTPTPTPFQPRVQVGFAQSQNAEPLRLSLSTDLIDFGPLTATNPVKREITITVNKGSADSYSLFSFEDHPLRAEEITIPDTTCDNGSCTEKRPSAWVNPLTFGFGFSLRGNQPEGFSYDDSLYQQFPDFSEKEKPIEISPGTMTLKLNINRDHVLPSDKHYENTIQFLLIPKY